jgi:hypothetical protein
LPPEKVPWCQVEMRIGGPRAKLDDVKKRSLCPWGLGGGGGAKEISEFIHPASSIVAIELFRVVQYCIK